MKNYTAIIEYCDDTQLYVGYVPGFPGAHSQGSTLDELTKNLQEVIELLLEEGEPNLESHFVGVQNISVSLDG
jgi:predicted RNase H-like HicB family nuclease